MVLRIGDASGTDRGRFGNGSGTHRGRIRDALGTLWGRFGNVLGCFGDAFTDVLGTLLRTFRVTHWEHCGDAVGTHLGRVWDAILELNKS